MALIYIRGRLKRKISQKETNMSYYFKGNNPNLLFWFTKAIHLERHLKFYIYLKKRKFPTTVNHQRGRSENEGLQYRQLPTHKDFNCLFHVINDL